jgi:hypothetical protein
LVFGKDPNLPPTTNLSDVLESPRSVQEHLKTIIQTQEASYKIAKENLETSQAKMKERYDLMAQSDKFKNQPAPEAGSIVYLHTPRAKSGTKLKLTPIFQGPFSVVRYVNDTNCKIKRLSDGVILSKSVHISRLKLAALREDFNMNDTDITSRQNNEKLNPPKINTPPLNNPPINNTPPLNNPTKNPTASEQKAKPAQKIRNKDITTKTNINTRCPESATTHNTVPQNTPAAKKNRNSPYQAIFDIIDAVQTDSGDVKVNISFQDGSYSWLPIENLNFAANEKFKALRFGTPRLERYSLRSRKTYDSN